MGRRRGTPFFARHAADYARVRPTYPAELFDYLVSLVERRRLAYDCATGNGQAARGLVPHFRAVVASDLSVEQVHQADGGRGVGYLCAEAERAPLAAGSVDLVTVAQAVHWFDLDRFWTEVRRLLAPGGVVAAVTYQRFRVEPAIDAVMAEFALGRLGPYWPPERELVDDGCRSIPFPFDEIEAPPFEIVVHWDLEETQRYLDTWSASRRYAEATGRDPRTLIDGPLGEAWGDPSVPRTVRWRVVLRLGRA